MAAAPHVAALALHLAALPDSKGSGMVAGLLGSGATTCGLGVPPGPLADECVMVRGKRSRAVRAAAAAAQYTAAPQIACCDVQPIPAS